MLRRLKVWIPVLIVVGLLAANIGVQQAHATWWNGYHWNKSGTHIQIQNYNYATSPYAAAAIQNGWNSIGILYDYSVNYHTDISVFDGNFGNTGWGGLASLESLDWDWGCFCYDYISHGHARYNSYYGGDARWQQGVFCQEIFHTYGFQHSNDGGCMGLSYWYGSGSPNANVYVPYNNSDFYNRYH